MLRAEATYRDECVAVLLLNSAQLRTAAGISSSIYSGVSIFNSKVIFKYNGERGRIPVREMQKITAQDNFATCTLLT